MSVRSLIQRFDQLDTSSTAAVDVPADRPTRGARSVLQLAEMFEPGAAARILERRGHSAGSEEVHATAVNARMRVLPGMRLYRLLRRRSRAPARPRQAEDHHGRRRQRHHVRYDACFVYRPVVKLSVAMRGPRRFLFELRGSEDAA
jgi:hypothetical protein